jgi:hypothetical protein
VCGLLGALLGDAHPILLAYGRFLRLYDRMETRLESELDHVYGRRLGPALMVFHVQLALRSWYMRQLDVLERGRIHPPDFCQGLHMLEVQNNLMWLPTVTNVPALLALRATVRVSAASGPVAASAVGIPATTGGKAAPAASAGALRHDKGPSVRNPSRDPRYVVNTPFARLVRSRTVAEAIAKAGCDPPGVVRNGVSVSHEDHIPHEGEEGAAFNAWCDAAYA